MTQQNSPWSDLPKDVLQLILKRVILPDYIRFSAVCKSWRLVSSVKRQPPWLMIPRYDGTCPFFCPSENELYNMHLPEIAKKFCLGSSRGWLVMRNVYQSRAMFLFNPFSKARIKLPPGPRFTHKVILSTAPETKAGTGCVVMGIVARDRSLRYCRLGDKKWRTFYGFRPKDINDVIFYKGQFYALDCDGRLVVCDVKAQPAKAKVLRARREGFYGVLWKFIAHYYLVESSGELLLVQRLKRRSSNSILRTTRFRVFKLDQSRFHWTEVESLGDSALFLGSNYSLCVSAEGFLGCQENRIYFTHDDPEDSNLRNVDMGVFNLETKRNQTCRWIWPPPVWVTPNPW